MVNKAAVEFVKRLVAAFTRWPTSKDTVDLYTEKLSKWRLTQAQWDRALDFLIERHEDKDLPGLADIYAALKKACYVDSLGRAGAYGWLSYEAGGIQHAIRVVNDGGVWIIASLKHRDAQGVETEMQKNIGKPVALHIPADAVKVIVSPDRAGKPAREQPPTGPETASCLDQMQHSENTLFGP